MKVILALIAFAALHISVAEQGQNEDDAFSVPTIADGGDDLPGAFYWCGYHWTVSCDGYYRPGPNNWRAKNAWLDKSKNEVHLKVSKSGNEWHCAGISTVEELPFGTYQFWVDGPLDKLDPNVVLGMFSYLSPDVDGTNEIDIEIARWGDPKKPNGHYRVWPNRLDYPSYVPESFYAPCGQTTHRFIWQRDRVQFQSLAGLKEFNDNTNEITVPYNYTFDPDIPSEYIPEQPLKVLINLYLFNNNPPRDNMDVEIIIKRFAFIPEGSKCPAN